MNTEPMPQQGGSYTRDPSTGDITRIDPAAENSSAKPATHKKPAPAPQAPAAPEKGESE